MSDKSLVINALEEIANYIDLSDRNKFKAIAYRRAARSLESVDADLNALLRSGELLNVPGVGKGIAPVIAELIETKRSSYLDSLRAQYPAGIFELLRVPGLGLKKIGIIYEQLGISTLDDLEAACATHRIAKLAGFGKKTEQKICEGIEEVRRSPERILLPAALILVERLVPLLRKVNAVDDVVVSGSVRRRLETVGDLDICVVTKKPKVVLDALSGIDALQQIVRHENGVTGRFRNEIGVDVYVTDPKRLPIVLLHSTGSKSFVDALVANAASRDVDLGIDSEARFESEEAMFKTLGLPFVPPELRDSAQLPRKRKSAIPLLTLEHIRGTFHIHTTYSDGRASVHEMLDACSDHGLEYAGISDHSKTAAYAGGLTEERLKIQQREIEQKARAFPDLRVFKGSEVDILADGALDYAPATLATFDFTVASVHSRFKMDRESMTHRIVTALKNPFVTILGHLTGRLLLSRPGYEVDYDAIFETAAKNGVMIEINANPHRLDLDWRLMRRAIDLGVILCLNPDAHSVSEMQHLQNGIWHARKAGLEPKHIFNTLPVEEVEAYLATRRTRAISLSRSA